MDVLEINKRDDQQHLAAFLDVATQVYHSDPIWVPQSENLFLQRLAAMQAPGQPLLHPVVGMENGRPLARGAAILVPGSVDAMGCPRGYIAFFECLPQAPHAGQLVLENCERWLHDQGARSVLAPRLDNMLMGLLVKGFDLPHTAATAYNPPYYRDILLAHGYHVLEHFCSFTFTRASANFLPLEIPGFRTRTFDRNQVDKEASVLHQLQYEIFASHLGYVPRSLEEDRQMIETFLPILDDDLLIIAEDRSGQPVGLLVCLPDIYRAFKGRPVDSASVISIGVLPALQLKGIGALMCLHLQRNLLANGYKTLDAAWIRAGNVMPRNLSKRFNGQPSREFALFEKRITS